MKEKLLHALVTVLTLLLCLGIVAITFFWPMPVVTPATYKGKVVEKFVYVAETKYGGTQTACYLLLETAQGRRVTVTVSPATYQQAQPGMQIEKTAVFATPALSTQPQITAGH